MRRVSILLTGLFALTPWIALGQRPAPAPAATSMLTVDSIMRGPKLVGSAPTNVRWSKDSSKVYFTWQKPDETRTSTWVINRDGSALRKLTDAEARALDLPVSGRLDRARRRALVAENGDVLVYDVASGTKRLLTRTSATESAPRWARNDTAVTFMRDGNLFLMSLDPGSGNRAEASGGQAAFVQLTDIVAAADGAAVPAAAGATGQRGAGGRGGEIGRAHV